MEIPLVASRRPVWHVWRPGACHPSDQPHRCVCCMSIRVDTTFVLQIYYICTICLLRIYIYPTYLYIYTYIYPNMCTTYTSHLALRSYAAHAPPMPLRLHLGFRGSQDGRQIHGSHGWVEVLPYGHHMGPSRVLKLG